MARKKQKAARRKAQRKPVTVLRDTWEAGRKALMAAEQQMEHQFRVLLKRNKINTKDVQAALKELRARAEKERRKALAGLDTRLKAVQARVKKERKALGRVVQDAVHSTLAALNIPSRDEIAMLTRKVDTLSHKLDARRR